MTKNRTCQNNKNNKNNKNNMADTIDAINKSDTVDTSDTSDTSDTDDDMMCYCGVCVFINNYMNLLLKIYSYVPLPNYIKYSKNPSMVYFYVFIGIIFTLGLIFSIEILLVYILANILLRMQLV